MQHVFVLHLLKRRARRLCYVRATEQMLAVQLMLIAFSFRPRASAGLRPRTRSTLVQLVNLFRLWKVLINGVVFPKIFSNNRCLLAAKSANSSSERYTTPAGLA